MDVIEKVKIHHSIVYDFLASMFRLNNNKKLTLQEGDYPTKGLKPSEDIEKWVQEMKEKIPQQVQEEIKKFFHWETFFGMCLVRLIPSSNPQDVPEFIDYLRKLPVNEILKRFLSTGYAPDEATVQDLLDGKVDRVKFIEEVFSIPREQKWLLLQFLTDPEKMKRDLLRLFEWYYENIFVHEIDLVESVVSQAEKELEKNLRTYGNDYLKILLKTDYSRNTRIDKILIAISYYYEFSMFSSYGETTDVYVIGYRYPKASVTAEHAVLSSVQLFKALADETRLNIIRLLAKGERYGRELARELGLSNSTVSYHLSLLIIHDLVTFERRDNRSYYSLNVEKMKRIINDSLDMLLD